MSASSASLPSMSSESTRDCRRVCRIAIGRGFAIHGVIFELDDGTRLGKFVDDDGNNLDLYQDNKAFRYTSWTEIEEGDSIEEVEFVATKKTHFLVHSLVFRTKRGREHIFSGKRHQWAAKASGAYKSPFGRPIVEVSFSEGEIHAFLTDRSYHPERCTSSSSFPKVLTQELDDERKAFLISSKKVKVVTPSPAQHTRSRSPNVRGPLSSSSQVRKTDLSEQAPIYHGAFAAMVDRPRPTKARHILAAEKSSAVVSSFNEIGSHVRPDAGENGRKGQSTKSNCKENSKAVAQLRQLVNDAVLANPSIFNGKSFSYTEISTTLGKVCRYPSYELRNLINELGLRSLAEGVHVHCSDLLTLKGPKECPRGVDTLRRVVNEAVLVNPSIASGQASFSDISETIEQHCKYRERKLLSLINHGLGFKSENPIEAIHFYCSDLLTANPQCSTNGSCKRKRSELDGIRTVVEGTIEILEKESKQYFVSPGEIYEVVRDSRLSWKVFAGPLSDELPSIECLKTLPKSLEGKLWRWVTPPVSYWERMRKDRDNSNVVPKEANEGETNDDCDLPFPWERHFTDDGVVFYFNEETGENQWEKPSLGV